MSDTYKTYTGGGMSNTDTATGGPGAMLSLYTTMNSAGSGDNSANVATHLTHLKAMFGTTISSATPTVIVNVDVTKVATVSRLRAIFNAILSQAASDLTP